MITVITAANRDNRSYNVSVTIEDTLHDTRADGCTLEGQRFQNARHVPANGGGHTQWFLVALRDGNLTFGGPSAEPFRASVYWSVRKRVNHY